MQTWDEKFMALARNIASWSKDPSTRVGAVIVGNGKEIRSTGYNGFPRGIEDTEERLQDRATKLKLIVHAEMNAILNAARIGVSTMGCTMYVSGLPPCTPCANGIVQAGIARVVVVNKQIPERWVAECTEAESVLAEAHVELVRMEDFLGH